jgi:virulence factor Mce-like protein
MSNLPKESFLSRILDQRPGRVRPRHKTNGALTLALVAASIMIALTVGFTRDIPFWNGGSELKAEFRQTPNLRVGYPVRVRGVNVGKVKRVERDADRDVAVVTMEINKGEHIKLKRDAHAIVAWRTLLGRNMFVDLDPGSPSAPDLGSDTVPVTQTEAQVEFDQLIAPFDKTGRAGTKTFLRQFDTAFRNNAAPGRNLDRLAPSLRPVGPAVDALRGKTPGDLPKLVKTTRTAMAGFGASESKLVGLINGADITFGVTAAQRASLSEFVRQAPATLSETSQTMVRLRTTLDLLDPVAQRARPGLRRLDGATRTAGAALVQARPLLADLRPLSGRLSDALAALRPASTSTVRFMNGLDPTLDRANDSLVPWLKEKNRLQLTNGQSIGPLSSVVASSAGQYSGAGTQLRFQGLASGEGLLGLPCATAFTDPAKALQKVDCSAFFSLLQGSSTMKRKK